MRDPFQNYDQWKTASPYDDEPDPVEEAQKFLAAQADSEDPEIIRAMFIIEGLLELYE